MTNNDIITTMQMSVKEAWGVIRSTATEERCLESDVLASLEKDEISGPFELHMAAAVLGIDGQAAIALRQAANLLSN